VVASRALLENWEPDEVGGGTVDQVYLEHYQITPYFPEREEAGTPNIVGAVLLATVLETLQRIGMERIHQAETQLLRQTLDALTTLPEVTVYGPVRQVFRTGTVAFNVKGLDHGLVAAVLNDYHNVAVRNECFCAHPYVREMLKPELWALDIDPDAHDALGEIKRKQGMVRASLGLYSNAADIDALLTGLSDLIAQGDHYKTLYQADSEGNYTHKSFAMPARDLFDPIQTLDTLLP
jgi:selenocysteine lyase/cysteine desulfurase